jgi:hypothetical protein
MMIFSRGEDGEQLAASPPNGFNPKLFRPGQMAESTTIRNGRRAATAENFRANCEMKFVHQTRPEQGVI